ncbi:MAG: VCBS repeat-containing protein [Planctomycetaceae bacterium]
MVAGIAYDRDGHSQASMGVAAGDVTGDGRIDILLTDFFAAGNALYTLDESGVFQDVSREFGIHDASLSMLGFGCQFADLDGDGWLDFFVTNGHVDRTTIRGGPDRMPPQLYRNNTGREFIDTPPTELGPFFQRGYLGRALALWTGTGTAGPTSPFRICTTRSPL